MEKRTAIMTVVAAVILLGTTGYLAARAGDDTPDGTSGTSARQRTLATGTVINLRNAVTITSGANRAGDPVSATVATAVTTPRGDVVIPAGSVVSGTILRIAESGSPSSPGTLVLNLTTLTVGANNYPIELEVTSLATHLNRAGVTTEDAAKVAVGAAVGAAAGRVIGENRTGAIIGAGAGAAAGTVYATQTRDRDIVLSAGAAITAVLSDSFRR